MVRPFYPVVSDDRTALEEALADRSGARMLRVVEGDERQAPWTYHASEFPKPGGGGRLP